MLNNANIKLNVGFRIVSRKVNTSISFYFSISIHEYGLSYDPVQMCIVGGSSHGGSEIDFFRVLEYQVNFMTALYKE